MSITCNHMAEAPICELRLEAGILPKGFWRGLLMSGSLWAVLYLVTLLSIT